MTACSMAILMGGSPAWAMALDRNVVSSPIMCGIAGAVGETGSARHAFVEGAKAQLRHRGPDADGERHFATCSLGHTRLRILDLTSTGDQPMSNESGAITVVFNGEIYNFASLREGLQRSGHRFRSRTDTEVLVHLYE